MGAKFISRTRQRVRSVGAAGLLLSFFAATTAAMAAGGPPPLWIKQLGGTQYDDFADVATDSAGNVVAVGQFANGDPWIVKFNAAGTVLWEKKPGPELRRANGVAIDGAKNIIVSLTTDHSDPWLLKYNAAGTLLWSRQNDSTGDALHVAVDRAGNIYTAGTAGPLGNGNRNAELVKYNPAGARLWAKVFGTDQRDDCNGIAVDKDNNVLLVGYTWGPLAGPDPRNTGRDAWLAKLDGTGKFLWTRQLDSLDADIDYGDAVAVDASGNVFVGGLTYGRFSTASRRGEKGWLAKYSTGGVLGWISEYSLGRGPSIRGLAVTGGGAVIATGLSPSRGVFVAKYNNFDGAFLGDSLIDSDEPDVVQAVAVVRSGNSYIAGYTNGDLGGPNKGRRDAFLAKFPRW